ncbi:F-box protein: endocytic membrane traffic, recycling ReCYcling 1 [Coemansia sp. RSA 1250]|nr:F-box protein: endocytic membrane traffic, recycling ReCYcling 1 [Coemansia sp. RSA 1250]
MADDKDSDGSEGLNLTSSWLSPRSLLDRTTKFVLNAAHGKSRSLLPTTENDRSVTETGILDWEDEEEDEEEEEEEEEEAQPTLVVPEHDVLAGRWNAYLIADQDEKLSPLPRGMLRVIPPRKRTATCQSKDHNSMRADVTKNKVVARLKSTNEFRRQSFLSLPIKVLGRILEFLPVDAMLVVLGSCRALRRVMHRQGPGCELAGDQAYTTMGMRVWRTRIQQMGWRIWWERQRGKEHQQRIAVPRSHQELLKSICGVTDETEILNLLKTEPDLVFKAIYDDLISDYMSFGSADRCVPAVIFRGSRVRGPAQVAQRLDQLLWFARGRFTCAAEYTNQRLVAAADRFEAEYQWQFKRALVVGDCEEMKACARVMENIRDGRMCIRVLVDIHPLFNGVQDPRYAQLVIEGNSVSNAHSFESFLNKLDLLVAEHARVVAAALPGTVLPRSALFCLVEELFAPTKNGLALRALQNLYKYLQAIPIATDTLTNEKHELVVPDEATKDIVFLTTVASVVSLLLQTVDKWAQMEPVALPHELARRSVFAAFGDIIDEYVQLERRVIERAYEGELAQWTSKSRSNTATSHMDQVDGTKHVESVRLINFQKRQQQMDEYKERVLQVLQERLQIRLDTQALGTEDLGAHLEGRRRRSSGASSMPRRTVVGDGLGQAPISIDMCLNMVLTNRDAVDRLAVFAKAPLDMRLSGLAQEAVETIFCVLLRSIGNHVRPAFRQILNELRELEHAVMVTTQQSNVQQTTATHEAGYSAQHVQAERQLREKFTAAELGFFELIHLSDLAVQMIEIYFKTYLAEFIDEQDFLNMANQERKSLEHAVDDNVAVGMDCVIEIIMRQTGHILDTEQADSDYSPDSNVSLTLMPTMACTRTVQFLSESTVVLQNMTGQRQIRDVFLAEVGIRLFQLLLEHIKKYQITQPGGFQLIADLNLVYDWASQHVDADTLRFFTALKDLANCFILAPRDLRGFLQDQYSRHTFDGVMRSEEVYDVVACRADYRDIRTQVEGHCDFM